MAKDSVQKRISKVRAPRVHITYDLETGNGKEQKELPFVTGVIGDFTGKRDPDKPLPKLDERKFVNIDMQSFGAVMEGMAPKAGFRVKNKLSDQGGEFGVSLQFNKLDDFRPEAVVQQIEPLRTLYEQRTRLAELRNKISVNEKLEDLLGQVMSNTEQRAKINAEVEGKKE